MAGYTVERTGERVVCVVDAATARKVIAGETNLHVLTNEELEAMRKADREAIIHKFIDKRLLDPAQTYTLDQLYTLATS